MSETVHRGSSIPDILDVLLQQKPERTAIVFDDRVVSYGELVGRVAALSEKIGDDFALVVTSDPIHTTIAWLACYHRGVSCALIYPTVYEKEAAYLDAKIPRGQIVTDIDLAWRSGVPVVQIDPSATGDWREPSEKRFEAALLLATSRSTGEMKLVHHLNKNLAGHHQFWLESFPLKEGDMVVGPAQLQFGYGFIVAITWALWSGKAVNFASSSSAGVRVHPRVTVSALSPNGLRRAKKIHGLRLAVSAGSMIHNDHWSWFRETYPGVRLANTVGATETLTCFLYSDDPTTFRLFPRYEGRVTGEGGEAVVGRPGYFEFRGFFQPAYWAAPELDAAIQRDGWTCLGDYAVDNGDGTFKFLGRNTISFDLENALRVEPRVIDCHYSVHDGKPTLLVSSLSIDRETVMELIRPFGVEVAPDRVIVVRSFERTPEGGKVSSSVIEAAMAANGLVDDASAALALQPLISFACVKNLFIRQMYFEKAGVKETTHAHPIDHITLLSKGAVRLTVRGVTTTFHANNGGRIIYIKKDLEHEFEALEDETLAYCVQALRKDNVSADILDPDSIPAGVDAVDSGLAAPLLNVPRVRNDRPGHHLEVVYA